MKLWFLYPNFGNEFLQTLPSCPKLIFSLFSRSRNYLFRSCSQTPSVIHGHPHINSAPAPSVIFYRISGSRTLITEWRGRVNKPLSFLELHLYRFFWEIAFFQSESILSPTNYLNQTILLSKELHTNWKCMEDKRHAEYFVLTRKINWKWPQTIMKLDSHKLKDILSFF